MREIRFRGKVIDCDYDDEKQIDYIGRFVHFTGFIQCEENSGYVEQLEEISGVGFFYVDLKSVGQYTGLKDKNGCEIYEGDVLRVWQEDEYIPNRDSGGGIIDYDCKEGFSQIGKVGFTGCSFDYSTIKTLKGKHEKIHIPIDWLDNYEIIGNIHDNPELLGDSN